MYIPNYVFCRNDRITRGGGVGILVGILEIKFKIVYKSCDAGLYESLFIKLQLNGVKLLFGVVYLPTGNLNLFEERHRLLFSKYLNIIVVGYYNCNLLNISRSNEMRALCLRLSLSILHNSKPSHYDLANDSTSLLDYFFVSNISMVNFSNQVQCPGISDHTLIFACFNFASTPVCDFFEYRNFDNIDWSGLKIYLSSFNYSLVFNSNDVDDKCSYISNLIRDLFTYVPIIRKRRNTNDNGWMNSSEISLARSLRDMALDNYMANRVQENWMIFCKLRNRAKRVIRRERCKYFTRLYSGLDTSGLWRVLKNYGCAGDDEDFFDSDFDADMLNAFFSGDQTPNDWSNFSLNIINPGDSFNFRCIDLSELEDAMYKIESKSVGIDFISIKFLKLIVHIFRLCY